MHLARFSLRACLNASSSLISKELGQAASGTQLLGNTALFLRFADRRDLLQLWNNFLLYDHPVLHAMLLSCSGQGRDSESKNMLFLYFVMGEEPRSAHLLVSLPRPL